MRLAFKEWAVIVDALGRGDQILILRKGGIHEGPGGFKLEQREFLLFPTQFHQQRESVLPAAQAGFDPSPAVEGRVRIEYFASVAQARRLDSLQDLEGLKGQHIWRDEVLAARFEWGRQQTILALAVRVHRLDHSVDLPLLPGYGGCKSWIELEREISTEGIRPVLNDAEFEMKMSRLWAPGTETIRV